MYYFPEGEENIPNSIFYPDSIITVDFINMDNEILFRDSMRQDILNYVSDLSADDTCDCSIMAVGYQPWGDTFYEYILFSIKNTDTGELIKKVRYHRAYSKRLAEYYDLHGSGPIPILPGVQIIDDECATEY